VTEGAGEKGAMKKKKTQRSMARGGEWESERWKGTIEWDGRREKKMNSALISSVEDREGSKARVSKRQRFKHRDQ